MTGSIQQPRCPYCHDDVVPGSAQLACNGCRAWQHQSCWDENGHRCSACGATETGAKGRDPRMARAYAVTYLISVLAMAIVFAAGNERLHRDHPRAVPHGAHSGRRGNLSP